MPLEEQAKKLERIVFHEKLGTVADKVERVAKLARMAGRAKASSRIATRRSPSRPRELAKADLVTEMVGEFPELQGVMGGYYARAEGQPDAVADAIRDHYKPVGQGDEVPTAPVTVAVSLADKLDTLVGLLCDRREADRVERSVRLAPRRSGVLQLLTVNQSSRASFRFMRWRFKSMSARYVGAEMRRQAIAMLLRCNGLVRPRSGHVTGVSSAVVSRSLKFA